MARKIQTVGFVGWRGMVGTVLLERMLAEGDLRGLTPIFFSTSAVGSAAPSSFGTAPALKDAFSVSELSSCDVIISCQGGAYTERMHPQLRAAKWSGYWIDAASTLRMNPASIIVLDPVNKDQIVAGIGSGVRDYVGGNCTVSLMLMALIGLFREGLIEWVSSMTYQAASGAGARAIAELVTQHRMLANGIADDLSSLETEAAIRQELNGTSLPTAALGAPLAFNVLPFIDKLLENGQSREEWKGQAEASKILGLTTPTPIDGVCVRVGALRSHSQGLTIKLTRDASIESITSLIASSHEWIGVVENTKEASVSQLTPAAVSGSLNIAIGRIRPMTLGPRYISAFTVGDQLLWGAAEPLRRVLGLIREEA